MLSPMETNELPPLFLSIFSLPMTFSIAPMAASVWLTMHW